MTIRIGDWLGEAWELIKQDFWMHVLVALIFWAVAATQLGWLIVGPLTCSYQYMIIRKLTQSHQGLSLNDLGKGFDVFLDAFVAWLLIGAFGTLGLVACLVGAIVVSGLLFFTLPLVVDRRMGFWDAISTSYNRTKSNWLGMTWLVIVLGLMVIGLTALTCGLGYFVAFPLQTVATVLAYRDNFGLARSEGPPAPAPPYPA